jgi:hypothetical protein
MFITHRAYSVLKQKREEKARKFFGTKNSNHLATLYLVKCTRGIFMSLHHIYNAHNSNLISFMA